jgi:hypothetical protein
VAITVKSQLSQVTTQLGILVAAVGNALPFITPDFLASLGIPQPAVHTISTVVAIALIVYQQKPKAPPAPPPAAGFITPNFAAFLTVLALLGALVFSLSGCAYMASIIQPAAQPFVLAAVDVAVAQTVSNQAGTDVAKQKAVAAKIKAVAQQVLAADTSVTSTVATLEVDLNAKIVALKLPPPDLAAALALAASVEAALTTYIQTTPKGQIVSTTQVAISDICNAVITAAGAYGV